MVADSADVAAPLGTYGNFAATRSTPDIEACGRRYAELSDRFALQNVARRLLPWDKFAVSKCLRVPIPGVSHVELQHDPVHHSGKLGQLQTCRSVWSCPLCQLIITERRRSVLKRVDASARASGLRVMLVTLTFSHHRYDSLASMLEAFTQALRGLTGHRRWRDLRRGFGMVGWVRALEVTWSAENGWHPHAHLLLYIAEEADAAVFADAFRLEWSAALGKQGLSCNEYGFDWTDTNERIAEYVAKWGREPRWDEAAELTKTPAKRGRGRSVTPLELLRRAGDGDVDAGALFREYAEAFKGRCQLQPTPGLSALLLGEDWREDAELMEGAEEVVTLALLTLRGWAVVRGQDARADLVHVLDSGDVELVVQLLDGLGVAAADIVFVEQLE